jgi:hypothetical protein
MKSVLKRGVLLATVVVGGAMVAAPSVAGAAPKPPKPPATKAKVVGTVKIDKKDPSIGYVLAQYRCTVKDPVNDPAHLWVSVKQSQSGKKDKAIEAEGSGGGQVAKRWADSHRNPVVCDGKTRTSRFTVDQVEGKAGAYGTLVKGQAWVQFCLFDDTTPKGDGQTDFGQPVSSMVWKNIH